MMSSNFTLKKGETIKVLQDGSYRLKIRNDVYTIKKFGSTPKITVDDVEVSFESVLEYEDPSMNPNK